MKSKLGFILAGALALSLAFISSATTAHAQMYVSNLGDGTIEKINPLTGADLGIFASGLTQPTGLTLDSLGNLYVSCGPDGGNTIMKFTPDGTGSVFATNALSGHQYLASDSANNIYAAYWGSSIIMKYTPGGTGSIFASSGLNGVHGLTIDSAGNVYAANNFGGTIEKFSPAGTDLGAFASGLSGPRGLVADSADNIYVTLDGSGSIEKFTPGGAGSVFATGVNGTGMEFDSAGNLYMANYGPGTVMKYTSGGSGSVFASSGLNAPYDVALVVPEPTSAALLLGSGAMLLLRRRRLATL